VDAAHPQTLYFAGWHSLKNETPNSRNENKK